MSKLKKGAKPRSRAVDNSLEGWSRIIQQDGERRRREHAERTANAPPSIVWNPADRNPNLESSSVDVVTIKGYARLPDSPMYSIEAPCLFRAADLAAFGTFLIKTFGSK